MAMGSCATQYLVPMAASIWSDLGDEILADHPAATFCALCQNHRLLQINDRPVALGAQWFGEHAQRIPLRCRTVGTAQAVIPRANVVSSRRRWRSGQTL